MRKPPYGKPKKSIFQAKSGQTELKNEANMVSIALDDFRLVSGGLEVLVCSESGDCIHPCARGK